jgi:hypothetical protein
MQKPKQEKEHYGTRIKDGINGRKKMSLAANQINSKL